MSQYHIARSVHDFLQRGVNRDENDFQNYYEMDKFFKAQTKTQAINLIAFALGYINPNVESFEHFNRDDLIERKVFKELSNVVDRMPTLTFAFIPLMFIQTGKDPTFSVVLRVQQRQSDGYVFVDMNKRRYDTFDGFLSSNRLPEGTLHYPQNGLIRYDATTKLPLIGKREIKRTADVWKGLAVVGNTAMLAFAMTPLAPVATPILLFVSNIPLVGFSIADLVDGCQHERAGVIGLRSGALAFSLVTFAASGLTTMTRVKRLRALIPEKTLNLLDRADDVLNASSVQRSATVGNVIVETIGTLGGWKNIPTEDWIQTGVMLCFAYRECFLESTAILLFRQMQVNGLVQFFQQLCPTVGSSTLRKKLDGPWLERALDLVFRYLNNNIQFAVDDEFTVITIFGYQIRFDALFTIDWNQASSILTLLQGFAAPASNLCRKERWTQDTLNSVLELLGLVRALRDVSCTIANYITLGNGHRFTIETVGIFMTTPDKLEKLRSLAHLDAIQTQYLNELRESGRIVGGDGALFDWLTLNHFDGKNKYTLALNILIEIATKPLNGESNSSIKFDKERMVISPLLTFNVKEYSSVPAPYRDTLLKDKRFLQLCRGVDEQEQNDLLKQANRVWLRTCILKPQFRELETISMLEQLFDGMRSTGTDPSSLHLLLHDALHMSDATVCHVYYAMLFAMKKGTGPRVEFGRLLREFKQGMEQASSLRLDRRTPIAFAPSTDEQGLIELARKLLPDEGTESVDVPLPFGHAARAACWLQLMPALRHQNGRERIGNAIRHLLQTGTASVLKKHDQVHVSLEEATNMVMFTNGDSKVIFEILFHDGSWYLSLYLCGSPIAVMNDPSRIRL